MNEVIYCMSGMSAAMQIAAAKTDCVVLFKHTLYRKQPNNRTDFPFKDVKYAMCDASAMIREPIKDLVSLMVAQQEMIGTVPCIPEDPFGPRESNAFGARADKSGIFTPTDEPVAEMVSELRKGGVTKQAIVDAAEFITPRAGAEDATHAFETVALTGTIPADLLRALARTRKLNVMVEGLELLYSGPHVRSFDVDTAVVGERAAKFPVAFFAKQISANETMVIGNAETAPKLFLTETRNVLFLPPHMEQKDVQKALYNDDLWGRLDAIVVSNSWELLHPLLPKPF